MRDEDPTYITLDTNQGGFSFPVKSTTIDLRLMQFGHINLDPLKECGNLQMLHLGENHISEIDLTPLTHCSKLEQIWLYNNNLRNLDLAPLANCHHLQKLDLHSNQINTIELNPLSTCMKLQELWLHGNPIVGIDLLPLTSCPNLEEVSLDGFFISSLDITPLVFFGTDFKFKLRYYHNGTFIGDFSEEEKKYPQIIDREPSFIRWLEEPYFATKKNPRRRITFNSQYIPPTWSILHRLASFEPSGLRASNAIVNALSLGHFGIVDYGLAQYLTPIQEESSLEDVRETVEQILLENLPDLIDRRRSVIGLQIDGKIRSHGVISSRIPAILKQRKNEIEKIEVSKWKGVVDLHSLWLTAYGFEILSSLGIGLTISENKVKLITEPLEKLGFSLSIADREPDRKLSSSYDEYEKFIIWIAECYS